MSPDRAGREILTQLIINFYALMKSKIWLNVNKTDTKNPFHEKRQENARGRGDKPILAFLRKNVGGLYFEPGGILLGIIFEILARREASFSVARKDYPLKEPAGSNPNVTKNLCF